MLKPDLSQLIDLLPDMSAVLILVECSVNYETLLWENSRRKNVAQEDDCKQERIWIPRPRE